MDLYDIVIIGAGPAGLMAAGHASELGARVLVLEKNKQAGIKLLMSGGGRCNFTNNVPDYLFSKDLGQNGKWFLSGLSIFNSTSIIDFFKERNIKSQVNSEGKVFPENNSALKVREALLNYVESNGGRIIYNSQVIKIVKDNKLISKLILADRSEISAKKYIITTGGNSYSRSGSSGEAYQWLKELGHKIIKPRPALCPIIFKEKSIKELEGLSFSNVLLSLYKNNKKIKEELGDIIFTGNGISGPAALNLSRAITLEDKLNLVIKIDFFPTETVEQFENRLQNISSSSGRESIKNILGQLIQKRFSDYILNQCSISDLKKGADITKEERNYIVNILNEFSFNILALGGFDQAMITVGGVDLKEVNQKTMASKIYSNLYFAGEILDLDGPTGGYNLQIAWTSGYLAGEAAALS